MANFTPPTDHIHKISIELDYGRLSRTEYVAYMEAIQEIVKKYGVRRSDIEYVRTPAWVAQRKKMAKKRRGRRRGRKGR